MRKFLIIFIILAVAALAVYFMYTDDPAQIPGSDQPDNEPLAMDDELSSIEPDPVFAEPVTFSDLKQPYSSKYFSLRYSEGFKVSEAPAEGGEIFTVENSKGSGFQIFVSPFDEPGPITPERIWQDIDMDINEPKNASLDGSQTLVFYGYDGDLGETFEAWTVHKGKLYQINGPKTAEQLIIETLETWRWK